MSRNHVVISWVSPPGNANFQGVRSGLTESDDQNLGTWLRQDSLRLPYCVNDTSLETSDILRRSLHNGFVVPPPGIKSGVDRDCVSKQIRIGNDYASPVIGLNRLRPVLNRLYHS